MPMKARQKATWQLSKPRLHETAQIRMATKRQEISCKDNKKIRRQRKLSCRDFLAELAA